MASPHKGEYDGTLVIVHSSRLAARCATSGFGLIVGPQVSHQDVQGLVQTFRHAWQQGHTTPPTRIGAWRPILIGANPHEAVERGLKSGLLTFSRYHEGAMQEPGTVPLRLTLGGDAAEWAIMGNYQDCRESLARCRDEMGLTHVTCQFHNLPEALPARPEYLEGFGAEVIQKLAG